ncbi:MAG: hypothetical protein ACREBU_14655 [Nitrososphaera sp.]
MSLPPLVFQYNKYCNCRDKFRKTGRIDLRRESFFPPTFSLPLALLLMENLAAPKDMPLSEGAKSYFHTIFTMKVEDRRTKTYIPLVRLPSNVKEASSVLQSVYEVQKDDRSAFGGEIAFKYVVAELVDNIYEHSKFKLAFVMAQRYPRLGYLELAFLDNGITIQGNYREHGMKFKPWEAIVEALNGRSTKSQERGWGLMTSIRIFREGLGGRILIVSGGGALYLDSSNTFQYKLRRDLHMKGTLISMRVPYPSRVVDIYKYLE